MTLPFGLERRDVDDDAAARVRRFAEAGGAHVAGDAEVLDGTCQRERVRRNDAYIAPLVDEVSLVERLGIDDGRVENGEDLEFGRAADVIAVAGSAVGHHAAPADLLHLPRLEWLDHPVLHSHATDPAVGLDGHVFCTTILGNLEVMSRCDSAILTAQRRAMRR